MAPDPIFGGLPCIVPVYPWLELDRVVRNLSCRDGLDKKEFFSLETALLLLEPGMEVVSVLLSVLVPGF